MNTLFTEKEFSVNEFEFTKHTLQQIERSNQFARNFWPLVYILSSKQKKLVYIGESTSALQRFKNHLANKEKKDLDVLHLIIIANGLVTAV